MVYRELAEKIEEIFDSLDDEARKRQKRNFLDIMMFFQQQHSLSSIGHGVGCSCDSCWSPPFNKMYIKET